MSTLQVGQRVFVPVSLNPEWTGEGIIERISKYGSYAEGTAIVRMTTGRFVGVDGGFDASKLQLVEGIKIIKAKRSNNKTGLKIYGKVLGESGKEYNFAYIRRPNFRGWICSCESFFFDMFKKRRNCKHLHFVRGELGRFGTQVPKEN